MLQKNIKPASGNSAASKRGVAGAGAAARGVFGTLFGGRSPNAPAHNEASTHGGAAGGIRSGGGEEKERDGEGKMKGGRGEERRGREER